MASENESYLLKAGEQREVFFNGNFVYVKKCTDTITIECNGSKTILGESESKEYKSDFNKFYIANNSNGFNEIDLYLSSDGKDFGSDATNISGVIETQNKLGQGTLYDTVSVDGTAKILDFDADRLFFSIENKTSSVLRLGGVDVLQRYIEIESNAKYSDSHAPTGAVYVVGNGKVSIASKYKTQQEIITPEALEFNGDNLTFNGDNLKLYN